jgi:hypothetical protein
VEEEKVSWEKVHTNIMGEGKGEKEYNHRERERGSSKIIVK